MKEKSSDSSETFLPQDGDIIFAGAHETPIAFQAGLDAILHPGTDLGGFVVGKSMGRGATARVYEAKDKESGRTVALKIFDPRRSANPEFQKIFLSEAGAMASLDHPNIVRMIRFGVDGPWAYIAMELIDGITLDQLIVAMPLTDKHFRHVIAELSKACTYMHARGLIHGDIKPGNILVTRPGDVKLLDFGIARNVKDFTPVLKQGEEEQEVVFGTRPYMAPELREGKADGDHRIDIFALGVTFYKMFTGILPEEQIRNASEVKASIPKGVDDILKRAMHPDPDNRFTTAKELADALEAIFRERDRKVRNSKVSIDEMSEELVLEPPKPKHISETGFQSIPKKNSNATDWTLISVAVILMIVVAVGVITVMIYL